MDSVSPARMLPAQRVDRALLADHHSEAVLHEIMSEAGWQARLADLPGQVLVLGIVSTQMGMPLRRHRILITSETYRSMLRESTTRAATSAP